MPIWDGYVVWLGQMPAFFPTMIAYVNFKASLLGENARRGCATALGRQTTESFHPSRRLLHARPT
jgi:hypothetical protein